jgi:alpha-glucosidase
MPFNFQLIRADWKANVVKHIVESYDATLPEGAWPNWVLGNHDQHRIASRIGEEQARVANTLLLTLRGTPTTYYGEEIGMVNVEIPLDRIQDPPAINQPAIAGAVGRDPERTPMQWEGVENAGFTSPQAMPWLPVGRDYSVRNVLTQEKDPYSMLNLYRKLTTLRRKERALSMGAFQSIEVEREGILGYLRTAEDADPFLIVLNFEDQEVDIHLGGIGPKGMIEVSTWMDRVGEVELATLNLRSNEGLVIRL